MQSSKGYVFRGAYIPFVLISDIVLDDRPCNWGSGTILSAFSCFDGEVHSVPVQMRIGDSGFPYMISPPAGLDAGPARGLISTYS